MILLIDTITWTKLSRLQKMEVFSSKSLYEWAEIQITHKVQEELEYRRNNIWIKENTQILPIKRTNIFQDALNLHFDEADSSILSNGSKEPDYFIVSEDRDLLRVARSYQFTAIQLIDLFRIFTAQNLISRRDLYNLAKILRELRNITEKKHKELKSWLSGTN